MEYIMPSGGVICACVLPYDIGSKTMRMSLLYKINKNTDVWIGIDEFGYSEVIYLSQS